jgi:hypothetical protein
MRNDSGLADRRAWVRPCAPEHSRLIHLAGCEREPDKADDSVSVDSLRRGLSLARRNAESPLGAENPT